MLELRTQNVRNFIKSIKSIPLKYMKIMKV